MNIFKCEICLEKPAVFIADRIWHDTTLDPAMKVCSTCSIDDPDFAWTYNNHKEITK